MTNLRSWEWVLRARDTMDSRHPFLRSTEHCIHKTLLPVQAGPPVLCLDVAGGMRHR